MRKVIAVFAGAWITAVPLLFMVLPDVVERHACFRAFWAEHPVAASSAGNPGTSVEVPCQIIDEVVPPYSFAIQVLMAVALLSACFLGGRLAAHIVDAGGGVVGSIAGCLPYALLALPHPDMAGAVLVAGAALVGALGAKRWRSQAVPGQ